jgi:phage/plasmid-like protein (TIGR03299 family)
MLFENLLPNHPPAVPISQVVERAAPLLLAQAPASANKVPPPRVNPWTKVGRAFEPTSDAREALHRSGLNWTVEKRGLRTDDLAPIPGQFAIRRSETGRVLGVVGPDYVPLQNEEAFGFFRELAQGGQISFETAGAFEGGAVTWVQARLPDLQIRLGDDVSETLLFISNGHIGNKALTIAPTTFRIVCRNTLRMAEAEHGADRRQRPGLEVGWTVRHTKGMTAAMADIREAYARTRRSHAVTVQAFEHLARTPLTDDLADDFFDRVFPLTGPDESDRALAIAKNRRERLDAILASPTSNVRGTAGTAFALLNVATEYIDFDRPSRVMEGGNLDESRLMSATFGSGADAKARAWASILELTHA